MDWCRTWSIHPVITISPPTEATADTASSSRRVSIDSSSAEELEQDATLHFRRYGCMKPARKRLRMSGTESDVGDFVLVEWIPARQLNDDTTSPTQHQHLYLEVWIQDAFSAAVIFCYWSNHAFEFCLARGLRSSYENMFGWMATVYEGHVGMVPFCPRSDDLANAVAAWISTEYNQQYSDRRNSSKKMGPISDGEAKPLTLTFTTPRSIAEAGFDTISLTVPPQALWKLYNSLCHCQSVRKEAILERDEDMTTSTQPIQLPPIVRAMQSYILEAFAIDIATFPLTKVVTSSATLGADGRYKPSAGSGLCTPNSLLVIRRLMNDNKGSLQRFVDAAI
jgi:Kinetochore complex Sim4 subunit Fta1